ncbi:MAG: nuclear transport factor 2 family protein [Phenylobacterium sp.]|uniref:nuclear transport factor 2 family protein n=1 Tax=Phenylobacterium sp. TaxID=1871053 RepID=UPI002736F53E|nr:nuclear transport factor 2 family protein [Phenylobacterium sp.]MDP3175853.1 nuclear transport factor 2 family protein [Phenylobacterium sp.]
MSQDVKTFEADFDQLIDGYVHPVDSPAGRAASANLLKAWFAAVHSKNIAIMPGMMADDIVIELPFNESGKTDQQSYRIYRGKAEVTDFWATAFKAEGVAHGISEADITFSADGARVFIECRAHLTMATGKEYRNRYVMRFDIRDGKIAHCKEYYNPIQSAFAFGRKIAGQYLLETL